MLDFHFDSFELTLRQYHEAEPSAVEGRGSRHRATSLCMALVITSIKLSSKSSSLIYLPDHLYVCALEICKKNPLLLSSNPAIQVSLH